MKTNKNRLRKQILLLSFLFVVFVFSVSMIYLGATLFRAQLPFFQLIDGESSLSFQAGPRPPTNPGVAELDAASGVRLYMILGSDYRPDSGFRTDILMVVAMDTASGNVSLISFPRDLWVTIPGYGEQRINTVMQTGGFQLLADTMQTNFGIYPTQYAMVDMEGFLRIIDELGGIEFETEFYTGDRCDSLLNPNGWCEVGPGTVSFTSDWALWYVRARYNSSDFDRMRRTQEVVKAVIEKAASPAGMLKMPALLSIYESEVESNINPNQMLPMINIGLGYNFDENIRRFSIGPNETTSWTTSDGGAVLLPNTTAIQMLLQEALSFE